MTVPRRILDRVKLVELSVSVGGDLSSYDDGCYTRWPEYYRELTDTLGSCRKTIVCMIDKLPALTSLNIRLDIVLSGDCGDDAWEDFHPSSGRTDPFDMLREEIKALAGVNKLATLGVYQGDGNERKCESVGWDSKGGWRAPVAEELLS